MSMFWIGALCGIAATIGAALILGAYLVAKFGDRVDNSADEHAQALGSDPGIGLGRE